MGLLSKRLVHSGPVHIYFNRHGAAPLSWCVRGMHVVDNLETSIFELAVRAVNFNVPAATVYAPKDTPDDDDGMPSAWVECTGDVVLYSDGTVSIEPPVGRR